MPERPRIDYRPRPDATPEDEVRVLADAYAFLIGRAEHNSGPSRAGGVVSSAWHEVCGRLSEDHLRFGASVEEVRSRGQAVSYAALYLAKEESFPEGVRTGRVWGVWNKKDLPVRWETVDVSRRDALVVMRAFRRLAGLEGRSFPHGLTVFVRHENVARLLAFLGYRLE